MSRKTKLTGAISAVVMVSAIISVATSNAAAQDNTLQFLNFVSDKTDDSVPAATASDAEDAGSTDKQASDRLSDAADASGNEAEPDLVPQTLPAKANTLEQLVQQVSAPKRLPEELRCLASAIYYEARGEPLSGQLAVAQVIINRAASGRFPTNYCAVVSQPKQFSFVRSGHIPTPNTSVAWDKARAIALIAEQRLWESPVGDALFFHATHVQPRWNLQRLARVSSHIFYR